MPNRPGRVPPATVTRLSLYARQLEKLKISQVSVISSDRLAELCHVNPAQIRKDLTYFGEFGVRGVGYYVDELLFQIHKIIGLNHPWNLALVGLGNLGKALVCYSNFANRGYRFVAAFDNDPHKIGMNLDCDLEIEPVDQMVRICREREIKIGAIATPMDKAQEVADLLIKVPIKGILNFAPTQLHVPRGVYLANVDFAGKLDELAYHLTRN